MATTTIFWREDTLSGNQEKNRRYFSEIDLDIHKFKVEEIMVIIAYPISQDNR